jgi:hypothetical protein
MKPKYPLYMSEIVNNYAFAKLLDEFKVKELDYLEQEVDKAEKIISDVNHQWKDEAQRKVGIAKFDKMVSRYAFLQKFYKEGLEFATQHEDLVNKLCKWYETWRNDISNNGKQEAEMMEMQADMLHNIFEEMYEALKPLGLEIKPPSGLNL